MFCFGGAWFGLFVGFCLVLGFWVGFLLFSVFVFFEMI